MRKLMAAATRLINKSNARSALKVAVGPYAAENDPCPAGTRQILSATTVSTSATHTILREGVGITKSI